MNLRMFGLVVALGVLLVAALWIVPERVVAEEPPEGADRPERPEAPAFTCKDAEGKEHRLSDYEGKWLVLEWTNYDCPFVRKHYHASHKNMQTLQEKYVGKDVVWLVVCSSAEGKQGHMTPEVARRRFAEHGSKATSLLLDPKGIVGRAYGARTTPDMRVIDPEGRLVYRGAIDDTPGTDPDAIPESKNYVVEVLDAVLAGRESPHTETRPYGCSVKYAE